MIKRHLFILLALILCSDIVGKDKTENDDLWYILPEYKFDRVSDEDILLGIYRLPDSIEIQCNVYKINDTTIAGLNMKNFISAVDSVADKTYILWTAVIQSAGKYTYTDMRLSSFLTKSDFKRFQPFLKGIAVVKDMNNEEIPIIIYSMLNYGGPSFDQYFLPTSEKVLIKSLSAPKKHLSLIFEDEFFYRSVDDIFVRNSHKITDLYYKDRFIIENCVNFLPDIESHSIEDLSIKDILKQIR